MSNDSNPDFEVPVGMFQDLKDLKAKMTALHAQVQASPRAPKRRQATPGRERARRRTTPRCGGEEDEYQYPPLILLLDRPPTTTNCAP
ncbi:hypothetical protein [Streptomyces sp. NPDC094149]|uniref:hypothetical protein n=1 Tax=Streptomyces sp. NPDC094149 TaxID=3155079 RepID=UPI00332EA28D